MDCIINLLTLPSVYLYGYPKITDTEYSYMQHDLRVHFKAMNSVICQILRLFLQSYCHFSV